LTKTTQAPAEKPVDHMAAARAARAKNIAEKNLSEKVAAAEAAAGPAPVHTHVSEAPRPAHVSPEVAALEAPAEIPAGPTSMEKAAATEDHKRLAKIAALRAAKSAHVDPHTEPKVRVRVLKKGHGQVSMGEHVTGLGDLTYDFGETFDMPQSIAEALEDRGFVEIQ
jgi:hypothetical protein